MTEPLLNIDQGTIMILCIFGMMGFLIFLLLVGLCFLINKKPIRKKKRRNKKSKKTDNDMAKILKELGVILHPVEEKPKKEDKPKPMEVKKEEKSPEIPILGAKSGYVNRICFTGGPCAGKTTAIVSVKQKLEEMGYAAYKVPEAATLLCKSGYQIANANLDMPRVIKFQINLMKIQIALEDAFTEIAKCQSSKKKSLILCDRGVMDGAAYMSDDMWQAMIDETGWTTRELRDKRYDMVLHLVTAATGAEEFYGNASNETRYEDLTNARYCDERVQRAYVGHSYFSIVDNSYSSFTEKIESCAARILRFMGQPGASHLCKKLLVLTDMELLKTKIQKVEEFKIIDTFITTSNPLIEEKISKSIQSKTTMFLHEHTDRSKKQPIARKRQISPKDYIMLLSRASNTKEIIKKTRYLQGVIKIKLLKKEKQIYIFIYNKTRYCFSYEGHYFILDIYQTFNTHLQLLRILTENLEEKINLPPHVLEIADVTDNKDFYNSNMADKTWEMPVLYKEKTLQAIEIAIEKGMTITSPTFN